MKIQPKNTVIQRVHGECVSPTQTNISVRNLESTIDEPPERGGANLGPTPTETLLSALVACTNVISHKCARKLGLEYETLSIDAEASFDNRGTRLVEEVEVPYPKIQMTIHVRTSATDGEIEQLKSDLRRFCPLAKIIRASGTQLSEIWTVERP